MALAGDDGSRHGFRSLGKFFTGAFSREFFLKRLVPCIYLYLLACLLVCNLLFPPAAGGGPGYIPFMRTISGQGNRADNPAGWFFFTAGLIGTSILLVPFYCFTWRRLAIICKGTASVSLFFAIAGAAGFAMVGIWDERSTCLLTGSLGECILPSHVIHDIGADIAFGGQLLAVLFNFFPMVAAKTRHKVDPFGIWWQLVHIASFIGLLVLGLVMTNNDGAPALLRRSAFWQWSLFVNLAIYYLSLALRMNINTARVQSSLTKSAS
nr:hypothetical protein [Candidatus Sigynarchaeota archaeon]